jgi:hypothetical protein
MRKLIAVATTVGAATLAPAAQAAGPARNCPGKFQAAPLSFIVEQGFTGQADQNGDEIVCIKVTNGGNGIFVDNNAR